MSARHIVVGIDVGGRRKGFHAVALFERRYFAHIESIDPLQVVQWCRRVNALAVGVDAPCRWSKSGRARAAERQLAGEGIHCFATPSRQRAEGRPFYEWMRNGTALYKLLEPHYRLFDGEVTGMGPICFETFPQAVACALARKIVSAKDKRVIRGELLRKAGIDPAKFANIDTIDAALCALTGDYLLAGSTKNYGDETEGFIVVPG